MKISQQKQQTLRQDMSNPHLNLQPQFFQNTHPQHELPVLPSPPDDLQHPLKNYEVVSYNSQMLNSVNQGQHLTQANFSKFYQEFKRIFSVSYNLQTQKVRLRNIWEQLQQRILNVQERLLAEHSSKPRDARSSLPTKREANSQENRNKRARRTAEQIQKKFKCQVAFCERYYGSQGSLQQHIKLKHPELLNKDSEQDQYLPYHNKEAEEAFSE